jgi:hypothetical protein
MFFYITKSTNFISHHIFFHTYTCTFATMICTHNSYWIRCYRVSNHLWIALLISKQLNFHISLDATNCWMIWLHFSFLSKLALVTSHSCICNYKPLFSFYNITIISLIWCFYNTTKIPLNIFIITMNLSQHFYDACCIL